MRLEAAHLGDLLRISVRTSTKTPRGPLSDFQGPRGNHGRRRSEQRSSRSHPYLPASGFQGRTTLIEKRELFPDSPAASPSSFRLPGRGTRDARRGSVLGSGIWTGFPFARRTIETNNVCSSSHCSNVHWRQRARRRGRSTVLNTDHYQSLID